MAKNYKDKIRKLLALAESPNEHEARATLLRARELMAEHKLSESDLKDPENKSVKRIMTDITCSKRRSPWVIQLSAVIGENYCCQAYRSRSKGKQTFAIGFIGLEDDVGICVEIFKYAVDCVSSKIRVLKIESGGYCAEYVTRLCNSYGYGFTNGVKEAFRKQNDEKEQGWGLVMVMPQEVKEASKDLGHAKFRARAAEQIYSGAYENGYEDGKEFNPARRLAEA